MQKRSRTINGIWTAVLTVLSLAWIYPIVMVVINSFKVESAISTSTAFQLPTAEQFAGLDNFASAIGSQGFLAAFFNSLVISVTSVVLILICCSMCAWFITRVNSKVTKLCYFLFVFSMVVPFQMLMFTLANLADKTKLNTPFNICIVYLGFGAGLAVFMFCGFMKSIPLEIEEAAMIDGCGPIRTFFQVSFPMAMPGIMVATLYTFLGSMEEAQGTLLVGLARIKTMPVEMYGIILDYPGQAGAVFAILLMIPAAVMILAMKKYIGPEAIAGGFKMK